MRKYEVAHLTPSFDIHETTKVAPALPAFEDAFAAFGRGAILRRDNGPVAVEDLLPGDRVVTSVGTQTLLWRGSMVIQPNAKDTRPHMGTMTRITTDAMGFGRPVPDLVLGPAARLLHKSPAARVLTGQDAALVPARDFIDGSQLIALRPVAAVSCYQLGFARHCCVTVNGVDVETLHPGPAHMLGLRGDLHDIFLDMFPHIKTLRDFGGLVAPRLRLEDLDLVTAA
tara:strand:+ start:21612 stop:22292 length:681 start_codon:yes stop_codon:yes gene_type:complete